MFVLDFEMKFLFFFITNVSLTGEESPVLTPAPASAAAKLFTANWILIHLIRFNLNKQPNFSPRLNSSTRKPNISQLCLFPKLYWSLTLFMKLNKSNCCPSLFWLFMVSSTFSNPAQMSKHHRFTIYINISGLHLSASIWGLSHIYDLFALPWFI